MFGMDIACRRREMRQKVLDVDIQTQNMTDKDRAIC